LNKVGLIQDLIVFIVSRPRQRNNKLQTKMSFSTKRRYITPNLLQQLTDNSDVKSITSLDLSLKYQNEKFNVIENLDPYIYLTSLNLSNHEFTDLRGLSKLKSLKILHADNNKITNINGIADLKNLTVLSLAFNCLENLPKRDIWESLKFLELLNLSNNKLNCINDLQKLQSNMNLKELQIANNPISEQPITNYYAIFWVPSLQSIDNTIIDDQTRTDARSRFANVAVDTEIKEKTEVIDQLTAELEKMKQQSGYYYALSEQRQRELDNTQSMFKTTKQELETKSHLLDVTSAARSQIQEELVITKLELENLKSSLDYSEMQNYVGIIRRDISHLESNKVLYEQKLQEYQEEIDKVIGQKDSDTITPSSPSKKSSDSKRIREDKHLLELQIENLKKQIQQDETEKMQIRAEIESEKKLLNELFAEKEAIESKFYALRAQCGHMETILEEKTRLAEEKYSLELAVEDLKKDLQQLQKEASDALSQADNERNSVQRIIEEKEKAERIKSEASSELQELKRRKESIQEDIQQLKTQLAEKKEELKEQNLEIQHIEQEHRNKLSEFKSITDQVQEQREVLIDLEQTVSQLESQHKHKLETINSLDQEQHRKTILRLQEEQDLLRKREILQKKIEDAQYLLSDYEAKLQSEPSWKKNVFKDIEKLSKMNLVHTSIQDTNIVLATVDEFESRERIMVHQKDVIEQGEKRIAELEHQISSVANELRTQQILQEKLHETQILYNNDKKELTDKLKNEKSLYLKNTQQLQTLFTEKEKDLKDQIQQLKEMNQKLQKEQEQTLAVANNRTDNIESMNQSIMSNTSEFMEQLHNEISNLSKHRNEMLSNSQLVSQVKEQKIQMEFLISQNNHLKREMKRKEKQANNQDAVTKMSENIDWIVQHLKTNNTNNSPNSPFTISNTNTIRNRNSVSVNQSSQTDVEKKGGISGGLGGGTNRLIFSFIDHQSSDNVPSSTISDTEQITSDTSMQQRIRMLLNWVNSTKNILKHSNVLMEDLTDDSLLMMDDAKRKKLRKLLSKFKTRTTSSSSVVNTKKNGE
jgi:chromosome segregation ATPase